jgi:hypothetical protein
VQSAHDLPPALDGLLGKIIAATNAQPHLEPTQTQIGRVEIDVAKSGLIGRDNL